MHFPTVPSMIKKLTKNNIVWDIDSVEKSIYLTFDDGPIPEVTPDVLNILDEYNAKATFFMIADNVRKYPEIKDKVISKGHQIGNHTFNHLNGWKTDNNEYIYNVDKAAEIIDSKLFRPPHGRITPMQIKELSKSYKIIMWSVLSGDYNKKIKAEECFRNVIDNTKSGSIIVFHDSLKAKEKVLYTLPKVLNYFIKRSYEFKAIRV